MTSLWFVTPAWKRYDLSAVCFEQRRRVIAALELEGIEAHCVVVADDANLDIARSMGFETRERDNAWLGRKFNDGMEYAGQHGADIIVPIGSDSWIHPSYFLPLARPGETLTSRMYCVVTDERLAELKVDTRGGAGPYALNRAQLAPSGFRPADDEISKGVDGSTLRGIGAVINWRFRDSTPLQYVGFRGTPHITRYERLLEKWGTAERTDPWDALATLYDADLVEAARSALSVKVAA